jgi:polysaccharide biosynthesis/export protein
MRRFAPLAVAMIVVTAAPSVAQESPDEYVIGAEDVLEIALWDNTAVSRTVPVRPDGKVSIPLLNDVKAAGLTPMQLAEFLNTALGRYIETPAVAVIVREVHSFKVSVIGEVRAPGRFQLSAPATVLDVLAMAGGLTEYARRGRIVVLRRHGAITKKVPFAYDRLVPDDGSKGQDNFLVQRDDIVLVP